MAAAPERCIPQVVNLNDLRTGDLDSLLTEEQLMWRSTLNWDFSASAELVRRFLSIRSLNGSALIAGSSVAGYAYYVSEERKGLIGDLYVMQDWAGPENETLLLSAVLQAMANTPGVERVEAQLMMLHGPFERVLPLARHGQVYPRVFMLAELDTLARLPELAVTPEISFELWEQSREDDAARVIAAAYRDHVDSNINDQYRSWSGARKFLHNVVQYPGCGTFLAPASLLAVASDGRVAGIVLTSLVASEVGHITQICLMPEWKGRGVGYELLRRACARLLQHGCERTSLTVTAENRRALSLYQSMGFRAVKRFAAYVWDGF